MVKQKKKLTPSQKAAKKKRPIIIDGMSEEEFIRNNADPIWLHQNEMWEYIDMDEGNNEC